MGALVFSALKVPETKGKSLEEIEQQIGAEAGDADAGQEAA